MAAASDPRLPWGKKHTELWLECFMTSLRNSDSSPSMPPSSRHQDRRLCTYCTSTAHFPDNCPQNPFRTQGTSVPYSRPSTKPDQPRSIPSKLSRVQPICHDYNGAGCQRRAASSDTSVAPVRAITQSEIAPGPLAFEPVCTASIQA